VNRLIGAIKKSYSSGHQRVALFGLISAVELATMGHHIESRPRQPIPGNNRTNCPARWRICENPIGEHRHATSPQAIRAFGGSGRHYSRTATHGNGR
jgi:hypothetical protein